MTERDSFLPHAPPCPSCTAPLSGAFSFEGATPSRGDLTVCIYCRAVLAFTHELQLRAVDAAEMGTWSRENRMEIETILQGLSRLPRRSYQPRKGDAS